MWCSAINHAGVTTMWGQSYHVVPSDTKCYQVLLSAIKWWAIVCFAARPFELASCAYKSHKCSDTVLSGCQNSADFIRSHISFSGLFLLWKTYTSKVFFLSFSCFSLKGVLWWYSFEELPFLFLNGSKSWKLLNLQQSRMWRERWLPGEHCWLKVAENTAAFLLLKNF